jgi:5-methylcytosine-specific restriction protein A
VAIYFQHVGEQLSRRDLPKTIGTRGRGIVRVRWPDVASHLTDLSEAERGSLEQTLSKQAPGGFQVWGSALSAKRILRQLSPGDYLLLLETTLGGGRFAYAGQAVAAPGTDCPALSQYLWGEPGWPSITFMVGGLTELSFVKFCEDFGFSAHWNPAGQTLRLNPRRLQSSPYETEDEFVRKIVVSSSFAATEGRDFKFCDPAEVDLPFGEERDLLKRHLASEHSGQLLQEFRERLDRPVCCVCKFDFERMYGPIGRHFIEAHYTKPPNEITEEQASADELVPVCSNCHRMLHRYSPMFDWTELKQIVANQYASWLESD